MSKFDIFTTFNIQESTSVIRKRFLDAVLNKLNTAFRATLPNLQTNITKEFSRKVRSGAVFNLIETGKLDGDLGLTPGEGKITLEKVVSVIESSAYIRFTPLSIKGSRFSGGITFEIMLDDFRDILSLPEAIIITDKFSVLPWLSWLLFEGNRVIIAGYEIQFGNFNNSRSGQAIMVQGSSWKVPTVAAGTRDYNFLTQAIVDDMNGFISAVGDIFEQELIRVL